MSDKYNVGFQQGGGNGDVPLTNYYIALDGHGNPMPMPRKETSLLRNLRQKNIDKINQELAKAREDKARHDTRVTTGTGFQVGELDLLQRIDDRRNGISPRLRRIINECGEDTEQIKERLVALFEDGKREELLDEVLGLLEETYNK